MIVEIGPNKITGLVDIDRNQLIILPGTSMEARLMMTGMPWGERALDVEVTEFVRENLQLVASSTTDEPIREKVKNILNQAFGK